VTVTNSAGAAPLFSQPHYNASVYENASLVRNSVDAVAQTLNFQSINHEFIEWPKYVKHCWVHYTQCAEAKC